MIDLKEEVILSADKFFLCANMAGGVCSVTKHPISNGFASELHCGRCREFARREEDDVLGPISINEEIKHAFKNIIKSMTEEKQKQEGLPDD